MAILLFTPTLCHLAKHKFLKSLDIRCIFERLYFFLCAVSGLQNFERFVHDLQAVWYQPCLILTRAKVIFYCHINT